MDSIGRIKIQGFKSIQSLEFDISSINVLVGANGSGKSNLVDAFEMLYEMRRSNFLRYVIEQGGAEHLLHFGSRHTRKIVLELGLDSGRLKYDLELIPTNDDNLALGPQRIGTFGIYGYPDGFGSVDPPREDQPQPHEVPFREDVSWGFELDPLISGMFGSHRVYRAIDVGADSQLKKLANLHDNRELRPDGSNLAPILYFLREKHSASYGAIRQAIQTSVPGRPCNMAGRLQPGATMGEECIRRRTSTRVSHGQTHHSCGRADRAGFRIPNALPASLSKWV